MTTGTVTMNHTELDRFGVITRVRQRCQTPADAEGSCHDAHRKLIKAKRVRINDMFSWQESRAVTRSQTLQYDEVVYLIKPGPENDKIAGQHVTVFDYPDGRFKIRYEGRVRSLHSTTISMRIDLRAPQITTFPLWRKDNLCVSWRDNRGWVSS